MLRKILLRGNKEHTFLAFLEMSDDTVHLKMKKKICKSQPPGTLNMF